jgi:hypothetical protein
MEAYFVVSEEGPRRPVSHYVDLLRQRGYACHEEPDEWGHWVVFGDRNSTLNFTLNEGNAVFVAFDMEDDPAEFFSEVESVFAEAGWMTEQGDEE